MLDSGVVFWCNLRSEFGLEIIKLQWELPFIPSSHTFKGECILQGINTNPYADLYLLIVAPYKYRKANDKRSAEYL